MTAEWRVALAGLRPGDRLGNERRSRGGEGAAARTPACAATAVATGGRPALVVRPETEDGAGIAEAFAGLDVRAGRCSSRPI